MTAYEILKKIIPSLEYECNHIYDEDEITIDKWGFEKGTWKKVNDIKIEKIRKVGLEEFSEIIKGWVKRTDVSIRAPRYYFYKTNENEPIGVMLYGWYRVGGEIGPISSNERLCFEGDTVEWTEYFDLRQE